MNIKKIFVFVYLFIFSFLLVGGIKVYAAETGSAYYTENSVISFKNLGYGLTYKQASGISKSSTNGTLVKQVVNMITVPSVAGLEVTSWSNFQGSSWKMSRIKDIVSNYESTHPGYVVLAAVNGDFYDISGEKPFRYQTTGALVSDGNFYKSTPSKSSKYNVLSFNNDGSDTPVSFATSVKKSDKPILAIYNDNNEIIKEIAINKVNEAPVDGEIAVYYGLYDSNHAYVGISSGTIAGTTYVVEKAKYSLPNGELDYYGIGTISNVLDEDNGAKSLGSGQFAIQSNNSELNSLLKSGVTIRVQYEWTNKLIEASDACNAGTQVLINGEAPSDVNTNDGSRMNARHPRTALGIKPNGEFILCVVDGRQEAKDRYGVYGNELAAVMKEYGCTDAFNLDGGGSSIMYYRENGAMVLGNSYSDASERSVSNVVLVAVKDPKVEMSLDSATSKQLTLNVNVLDKCGHDFTDVYVRIGTSTEKVVDGKVTITGLEPLTNYKASVLYYTSKQTAIVLNTAFNFPTKAMEYKIKTIDITKLDQEFYVSILFTDRGKATNLSEATIIINDKEYKLDDGAVTVSKADIGDRIETIILKFTNKTYDGVEELILVNPHMPYYNDLIVIKSEYLDFIQRIFK